MKPIKITSTKQIIPNPTNMEIQEMGTKPDRIILDNNEGEIIIRERIHKETPYKWTAKNKKTRWKEKAIKATENELYRFKSRNEYCTQAIYQTNDVGF